MKIDILKAGGILIENKRLLIARKKGESHFIALGGRIEKGETPKQALIRELKEEVCIKVREKDLKEFGTFTHPVFYDTARTIKMHVFTVSTWEGELKASNEIEEIRFVNSKEAKEITIGSIVAEEVVPRLKNKGLID